MIRKLISFFFQKEPAYKKFAKNSYEVWHCKEYGM